MLRRLYKLLFLPLFLFLLSFERIPALTTADVVLKLKEISQWHSCYKQIDGPLIKRALEVLFDELDPFRCYFLEGEVAPWLNLGNRSYDRMAKAVSRGDLAVFEEIYESYLQAIMRRRELEDNLTESEETVLGKEWPKTEEELTQKLGALQKLQKESAEALLEEEGDLWPLLVKRRRQREDDFLRRPQGHVCCLALKATSSAFDSHTRYFTPAEAEEFMVEVQQRLYGIGVLLQEGLSGFKITKVFEEGPAFASGEVHEGDLLVAIDDQPIIGFDIREVVSRLKNRVPEPVKLTLITPEGRKQVTIERKEVVLKENRLEVVVKDSRIVHVILPSFYQGSSREIEKELKKIAFERPIKGIVLDFRGNLGGLLTEAVSVAGLFLDRGAVVGIKDDSGHVRVLHDAEGKNIFRGPLIVLVNSLSASASEIVAQTLQDWGRALVVGDLHTYGKGTYQVFTLNTAKGASVNPKGEFKVTMGCYYTASGRSVQLRGVMSDIIVPSSLASLPLGEAHTPYPLPGDSIEPLFNEKENGLIEILRRVFKKGSQRQSVLDCFTCYLPELKKRSKIRLENKESISSDNHEESSKAQLDECFAIMNDFVRLAN